MAVKKRWFRRKRASKSRKRYSAAEKIAYHDKVSEKFGNDYEYARDSKSAYSIGHNQGVNAAYRDVKNVGTYNPSQCNSYCAGVVRGYKNALEVLKNSR